MAALHALTRRRSKPESGAARDETEPQAAAAKRRPFTGWDWLGMATLASLGSMLAWAAARPYFRREPSLGPPMRAMLIVGIAALAGVGVAVVLLGRRGHVRPDAVPGLLIRVWLDPPRDWVMFVFGVLVTIPMAAYFTRVVLGDADSARILASVLFVQRHGLAYVVRTQDALLPHALFGPAVAMGSIALAKVVCVLSVQALAGVVSYLSWKVFRTAASASASILALLSFRVIPDRAGLLPMYPLMLALAYLGVFMAYRAIQSDGRRRTVMAMGAGLCLALSAEAHNIGLFFFVVPALLVVTTSFRRSVEGLLRVYGWLLLFYLPRAIINLADGGVSYFFLNRVDYWISKGYLAELQARFYHLPVRLGRVEYVRKLALNVPRLTGSSGLLPLTFATVAVALRKGRMRWFALVALAYLVLPQIVAKGPFYPRYYSPVFVGVAIGAGAGIPLLRRRSRPWNMMVAVLLSALLVTAGITFASVLDKTRDREAEILRGPYAALARVIDDGKGVIGSRSTSVLFTTPRIATYGGQFLSERDFVTYLTWPSDQEVIRMLRAHNIGWVLLGPRLEFEIRYQNIWLRPNYGKRARQVEAVEASPSFCLALDQGGFLLYRLGSCPPFEAKG